MSGKFITLEGSEGSGKSTQARLIEEYLRDKGHDVFLLREPGGVKISEDIRSILLDVNHQEMSPECETLLYMAARAQMVKEVLLPALKQGKTVLCDRFLDSTFVYQGYGIDVDVDVIKQIGAFATQGVTPDLTLLFDIDIEQGLSRTNSEKDRIELRSHDYHQRVRQGYLTLAEEDADRIKVITVDGPVEVVFEKVRVCLESFLGN